MRVVVVLLIQGNNFPRVQTMRSTMQSFLSTSLDTVISTRAPGTYAAAQGRARLTSVPRAVCLCVSADNRHAVLHGPA